MKVQAFPSQSYAPIYIFSTLIGIFIFFSSEYLEPYCRLKTFELSTKADSISRNSEFMFSLVMMVRKKKVGTWFK